MIFSCAQASAQASTKKKRTVSNVHPQINYELNRFANNGALSSFYEKLASLKEKDSGTVNIVHIGDSHTQAGFITEVIRNGLQKNFGNAGRGLIFPYRLAHSNAPSDIVSYSNIEWEFNRLAHPEISMSTGISGFCIQTNKADAFISIYIKPNENGAQEFKKLKFFIDDNSWKLKTGDVEYTVKNEREDSKIVQEIDFTKSTDSFSIYATQKDSTQSFYGVSLEKDKPGILYHTIGVNGARYDQYNNSPLFWKQLPALQADLFIISLGTNEAQRDVFNEKEFEQQLTQFLQKLKKASPNAIVMITTASDSFKKHRSNKVLQQLNNFLYKYCTEKNIPMWDFYRITNGFGAAYNWLKKGYMTKDGVHLQPEGYKIEGNLLLDAFMKEYKKFTER